MKNILQSCKCSGVLCVSIFVCTCRENILHVFVCITYSMLYCVLKFIGIINGLSFKHVSVNLNFRFYYNLKSCKKKIRLWWKEQVDYYGFWILSEDINMRFNSLILQQVRVLVICLTRAINLWRVRAQTSC